ncbi:hypothetical protein EJB05_36367, partial [Eragrostis curvula]
MWSGPDVCHAYQIMKKGGLKDENIIVFMYDDIANNTENPWPGVIINHPNGTDVYAGVPKDYTGNNVNVHNFLAVLLGDNSNLTGGSGKVVNSGPDDHISSSTTPITRRRKAISPTALKAITTYVRPSSSRVPHLLGPLEFDQKWCS